MLEENQRESFEHNAKRHLNIAIILAGGGGFRAAQDLASIENPLTITSQQAQLEKELLQKPKQFWPLGGMPVWQHSWLRYASHPEIDKVCLVWSEAYIREIQEQVLQYAPNPQRGVRLAPCQVIAGGQERSDSSRKALEYCQQWQSPGLRINVLIHDAARPLVSKRIISDSLAALQHSQAVVCAIAAQDSIFIRDGRYVASSLNRQQVMQSQTPQSFELTTLLQAFTLHQQRNEIFVTDDISLITQYIPLLKIQIIEGEIFNMKLTQPWDLQILSNFYKIIKHNNLTSRK